LHLHLQTFIGCNRTSFAEVADSEQKSRQRLAYFVMQFPRNVSPLFFLGIDKLGR
jgi:hypothetical protein